MAILSIRNRDNGLHGPCFPGHLGRNRNLSGRKARWTELLYEFPVKIVYRKGQYNIVADCLSCCYTQEVNAVFSIENKELLDIITENYAKDNFFGPIYDFFCDSSKPMPPDLHMTLHWFSLDPVHKLLIYVKDGERRLCIPREKHLIRLIFHEVHDPLTSAHSGIDRAFAELRSKFFWPKMKRDVVKYVKTCHRCQVNKPYRKRTSAPLQLMPIPETPWEVISLDFITNLPKSKGYDSILVVVCYLTKMTHLIPTHMTADAVKVAELFIEHIFQLHGLPKAIVSHRDPKFTSKFWQALFKTLETQL